VTVIVEPQPLIGALIAVLGLAVAWALLRFVPEALTSGVAGAISGAFGVLALQRLWPGLPLAKIPLIVAALVVYGLAVGFVGRL
jgi:cell division protein FtsX